MSQLSPAQHQQMLLEQQMQQMAAATAAMAAAAGGQGGPAMYPFHHPGSMSVSNGVYPHAAHPHGMPFAVPMPNGMFFPQASMLTDVARQFLGMDDPSRGINVSCHQCKTTKVDRMLLFCASRPDKNSRKRKCRKKYCDTCLRRCYNMSVSSVVGEALLHWICPACNGLCACASCQRKGHGRFTRKPEDGEESDDHDQKADGAGAGAGSDELPSSSGGQTTDAMDESSTNPSQQESPPLFSASGPPFNSARSEYTSGYGPGSGAASAHGSSGSSPILASQSLAGRLKRASGEVGSNLSLRATMQHLHVLQQLSQLEASGVPASASVGTPATEDSDMEGDLHQREGSDGGSSVASRLRGAHLSPHQGSPLHAAGTFHRHTSMEFVPHSPRSSNEGGSGEHSRSNSPALPASDHASQTSSGGGSTVTSPYAPSGGVRSPSLSPSLGSSTSAHQHIRRDSGSNGPPLPPRTGSPFGRAGSAGGFGSDRGGGGSEGTGSRPPSPRPRSSSGALAHPYARATAGGAIASVDRRSRTASGGGISSASSVASGGHRRGTQSGGTTPEPGSPSQAFGNLAISFPIVPTTGGNGGANAATGSNASNSSSHSPTSNSSPSPILSPPLSSMSSQGHKPLQPSNRRRSTRPPEASVKMNGESTQQQLRHSPSAHASSGLHAQSADFTATTLMNAHAHQQQAQAAYHTPMVAAAAMSSHANMAAMMAASVANPPTPATAVAATASDLNQLLVLNGGSLPSSLAPTPAMHQIEAFLAQQGQAVDAATSAQNIAMLQQMQVFLAQQQAQLMQQQQQRQHTLAMQMQQQALIQQQQQQQMPVPALPDQIDALLDGLSQGDPTAQAILAGLDAAMRHRVIQYIQERGTGGVAGANPLADAQRRSDSPTTTAMPGSQPMRGALPFMQPPPPPLQQALNQLAVHQAHYNQQLGQLQQIHHERKSSGGGGGGGGGSGVGLGASGLVKLEPEPSLLFMHPSAPPAFPQPPPQPPQQDRSRSNSQQLYQQHQHRSLSPSLSPSAIGGSSYSSDVLSVSSDELSIHQRLHALQAGALPATTGISSDAQAEISYLHAQLAQAQLEHAALREQLDQQQMSHIGQFDRHDQQQQRQHQHQSPTAPGEERADLGDSPGKRALLPLSASRQAQLVHADRRTSLGLGHPLEPMYEPSSGMPDLPSTDPEPVHLPSASTSTSSADPMLLPPVSPAQREIGHGRAGGGHGSGGWENGGVGGGPADLFLPSSSGGSGSDASMVTSPSRFLTLEHSNSLPAYPSTVDTGFSPSGASGAGHPELGFHSSALHAAPDTSSSSADESALPSLSRVPSNSSQRSALPLVPTTAVYDPYAFFTETDEGLPMKIEPEATQH